MPSNDIDNMTRDELVAEIKRLRRMTSAEPERPLEYIKIIAFSILAACVYGIAHDLVTAHLCVAYFLPPVHPVIIPTDNPLLLALVWGIVATWWAGLFLGIPFAFVCQFGSKPKLTIKNIMLPVLIMLVIIYVAAMLLGVVGYIVWHMGLDLMPPYFGTVIAPEHFALFQFNLFAHNAAYFLGAVGGIVLLFRLWKKRQVLAFATGSERSIG